MILSDFYRRKRPYRTCLVNLKKGILGPSTMTFLAYKVDSEGIRPFPEKVAAIRSFRLPTTKLDVQGLLGMANFYRRFLPQLAHVVCPLTNSLATTKREFTVTKEMLKAINTLKDLHANATLLVHPIRNAVLSITTDSSDCAIRGVLHQYPRGHLQPLVFFLAGSSEYYFRIRCLPQSLYIPI